MKNLAMNAYRFRPLTTECEFEKAKSIVETQQFWCSKFIELNDPMEGVFATYDKGISESIFNQKMELSICSFSNRWALRNPAMWGYYAGGMRGLAIEIRVSCLRKVEYVNHLSVIDGTEQNPEESVLLKKFKSWRKEHEYRFISKVDQNLNKIGNITGIYFGNPFSDLTNNTSITNNSRKLQQFLIFRDRLIDVAQHCKIKCFNANIDEHGSVKFSPIVVGRVS